MEVTSWGNPDIAIWPTLRKTAAKIAAATAIAYTLMLLFWPYALSKPFIRPFTTIAWFSRDRGEPSPIGYIPLHLIFKLPELVILLLAAGFCLAAWNAAAGRTRDDLRKVAPYALLALATVFPPAYAAAKGAFLYDEIRHFLFIIPPLFCFAGITMHRFFERVPLQKTAGKIALAAVAIYLASLAGLMMQLHPYEYSFYNRLIGGVNGAYRNGYETDYWASSYREGVRQVEQYFRRRDGAEFDSREYRILVGHADFNATHYFPSNFIQVTEARDAEVYLSTTRWGSHMDHEGDEIAAVTRFGTPFLVARKLIPAVETDTPDRAP